MREMGFKKSTDLIPSAVPTFQPQTPQQKALSEVRKRTMESEETEQTAGKSSKNRQLKRSTRLGSKPRSCPTITKLNRSRTLLTSEGLLAVPGTSIENASETEEKPMELTEPSENETSSLPGPPMSRTTTDFESSQRPPKGQQYKENKKEPKLIQQNRKRRYSQTLSAEEKLNHAEKAIKAIKRHSERGTCPESLKYTARARIRADTEFKTGIKRIRKTAKQEFVKALTRFHYRETDRFRSEIKREKRPKVPNKTTNTDVTRFSKTKKSNTR